MTPDGRQRVVVKLGGSRLLAAAELAADLVALALRGTQVVVVHGGRVDIDAVAHELGRPPRHARSISGTESRLTDAAALDTVLLGLLGRRNPALVSAFTATGLPAVGLSGQDGRTVAAHRRTALKVEVDGKRVVVRDDLSGRVTSVDPRLLEVLLEAGFVPVVCPPADGGDDGPLNVDADTVAAAVAVALRADALVVLTDVPGVLADLDDVESLFDELPADRVPEGVTGRMHHKIRAVARAAATVPYVVVADGRTRGCVQRALDGAGTRIVAVGTPGAATGGPE